MDLYAATQGLNAPYGAACFLTCKGSTPDFDSEYLS